MISSDAVVDYFYFAVTEDGRKLFLPSGRLNLGYILPSEETYARLRRVVKVQFLVMSVLSSGMIVWMDSYQSKALVAALAPLVVGGQRLLSWFLCRGLETINHPPARRAFIAIHGRSYAVRETVEYALIGLATLGAFLASAEWRLEPRGLVVFVVSMAAVNIGLSSIPFAMLLFAKWREAHRRPDV